MTIEEMVEHLAGLAEELTGDDLRKALEAAVCRFHAETLNQVLRNLTGAIDKIVGEMY